MRVRDILARKGRELHFVKRSASVRELIGELARKQIGAVIVLDETNLLCGIVSERDVLRMLDRTDGDISHRRVEEIMTKEVVCASSEDTIESVMEMMMEGRFRHLPVIDNGELKGILSIRDVVQALATDLEYENQVLKEYVMCVR